MHCRQNLLPRRAGDFICFVTFFLFLPICFVYNVSFILPSIYAPGTARYIITYFIYIFLVFNIIGNFLACWLIDTSVNVKKLDIPQDTLVRSTWHECKECKYLMPPRSWHCKKCNCCILTMNHHCLFVGTCIGHYNLRYFLMFVIYVFIGSCCVLTQTSYYLWCLHWSTYGNWLTVIKMMSPHLLIFYGQWIEGFHLLIFDLTVFSTVCSFGMLLYHFPVFLRGGVCYERKIKKYMYDRGSWRNNLRQILGDRMHIAWLSPLIKSPLPSNGMAWIPLVVKNERNEQTQLEVIR